MPLSIVDTEMRRRWVCDRSPAQTIIHMLILHLCVLVCALAMTMLNVNEMHNIIGALAVSTIAAPSPRLSSQHKHIQADITSRIATFSHCSACHNSILNEKYTRTAQHWWCNWSGSMHSHFHSSLIRRSAICTYKLFEQNKQTKKTEAQAWLSFMLFAPLLFSPAKLSPAVAYLHMAIIWVQN